MILLILVIVSFVAAYDIPNSGACNNPADIKIINETTPKALDDKLAACTTKCLTSMSCTFNCIRNDIGFSPACCGCFAADTVCTVKNCIAICTLHPRKSQCYACMDKYCSPAFYACSGVVIPR